MKQKKLLLAILAISIYCNSSAQIMWEIKNEEIIKWKYHSGDEFNTPAINESYWLTGPPYGRSNIILNSYHSENNFILKNNEVFVYVDSNSIYKPIESWLLDSVYLKKNNINPLNGLYKFQYTVGMLWSKQFYKYGYFEARFKADKGTGLWPAFWLYGQNQKDEIDFFELKGEKLNKIHVDVHCKNGCDNYKTGFRKVNWGGWVDVKEYLSDGYNTIAGIWEPGYVTWFLNGNMIGKFKGDFETSMSLILNTAVTKDNYAFKPGPDKKTPFPSGMLIDYVRVFGKNDTTKSNLKPQFNYVNDTTNIITHNNIKAKKYIFKKKRDDNATGFISYYTLSRKTLLFEIKGKLSTPTLTVTNSAGQEIVKQPLIYMFNEVDISKAGHGDCNMVITVSGKKIIEEKIHVGH